MIKLKSSCRQHAPNGAHGPSRVTVCRSCRRMNFFRRREETVPWVSNPDTYLTALHCSPSPIKINKALFYAFFTKHVAMHSSIAFYAKIALKFGQMKVSYNYAAYLLEQPGACLWGKIYLKLISWLCCLYCDFKSLGYSEWHFKSFLEKS